MLSLGQKVLAVGVLLFIDVLSFVFFPLMGIVAFLLSIPLGIAILKQ